MAKCNFCNRVDKSITRALNFCRDCILTHFTEIKPQIEQIHKDSREQFNLQNQPPTNGEIKCNICFHQCKFSVGEKSYCGLRTGGMNNQLEHIAGTPQKGFLSFYYDPLPTNCVADHTCQGHHAKGYKNLAVFYHSCNYNCLFCQNWHFKLPYKDKPISSEELASYIDNKTFCICFFGGDPTTQILHAIDTSIKVLSKTKNVRICWETNGSMVKEYTDEVINIVKFSKGCIKFDIKTFHEELNIALCGVSNKQSFENLKYTIEKFKNFDTDMPAVVVSTLLIPGYITDDEVYKIASFISKLDRNVPYILLAFYPCFLISDLPTTSKEHAYNCYKKAKLAGLKNVYIGNIHLLDSIS